MSPHTKYSGSGPKAKLVELKVEMSLSEIGEKLQRKPNEEQIIFTGEHPKISEIFEESRKLGYKIISLVTDGDIFQDSKYLVDMVMAGLTDIQIKVNDLTENKLQILKKILKLRKTVPSFFKPSLSVGIYVSENNKNQIKKFINTLEKIKIPEVFLINQERIKINIELPTKTKMKFFTLGFNDKFDYKKYCRENKVINLS